MADLIIRGLTLEERRAVNQLAAKSRTTQAEILRRAVRALIGSGDVTERRRPTITEEIARHWKIPGQDPAMELAAGRLPWKKRRKSIGQLTANSQQATTAPPAAPPDSPAASAGI